MPHARAGVTLPILMGQATGALCMHIHRPVPRARVRACSRPSPQTCLIRFGTIAVFRAPEVLVAHPQEGHFPWVSFGKPRENKYK